MTFMKGSGSRSRMLTGEDMLSQIFILCSLMRCSFLKQSSRSTGMDLHRFPSSTDLYFASIMVYQWWESWYAKILDHECQSVGKSSVSRKF